ncbi:hydrogenase 4 subunit B [Emcibacter sp. SYSU 3D8]|uniref:hydrogenase 4 subunit B n=1 Tax=Emcibacter sp. SYSU 3D8 TaxID=3133969 RepID=UPI0031FE552E
MSGNIILWCVAGLLSLAPAAVALVHWKSAGVTIYGACLVLTLGLLALAIMQLLGAGPALDVTLQIGLPWIGAHFRSDGLSALFMGLINLGGAAASLYGLGYGRHDHAPHRTLPFYPAFLGAMNLVVIADDAFTFLVSWEFMSLTSWALVMAQHRVAGNARAGYVYILMASFGTMALLLAFGLLAGPAGGYAFDVMRAGHAQFLSASLVLVLALVGAGSKAGLVPLHVWLPLAHPAAPSHVSALMSGVMTKVAVYAFVRITFDLLGQPVWWWGMLVLAAGGITTALGLLYALMERDLKRVLAYSTIENIGFIFVGLGLALAFQSNGLHAAAALAFTAALFHALNHTLFKSLLFMGAGSVLAATGERDLDRLGGLIHRMPVTAGLFLVGCAAISALPPLNGFVSEWLTLQAVLESPQLPQWGLKIMVPAIAALLALAAALAAACFVRAFGIGFLGRPRSEAAAQAHEVDRWSLAAMAVLALLCLLVGILPGFVIDGLAPVVSGLVGARMPSQSQEPWLSLVPVAAGKGSYNGLLVFCFVLVSGWLAAFAIHRLASRATRRAPAWDCGRPDPSPAAQYTAGSFAQPIRRVMGTLVFDAREIVVMPQPGDMTPARFTLESRDLIWEWLFLPIAAIVGAVAGRLNQLQFLTIRRYLTLVFLSLVILLLVLAIW